MRLNTDKEGLEEKSGFDLINQAKDILVRKGFGNLKIAKIIFSHNGNPKNVLVSATVGSDVHCIPVQMNWTPAERNKFWHWCRDWGFKMNVVTLNPWDGLANTIYRLGKAITLSVNISARRARKALRTNQQHQAFGNRKMRRKLRFRRHSPFRLINGH